MLHRHAPDVVSLVFGILFAGFTTIWLLSETDVIDYQQAWLAGPVILIIAGVLGLTVALRPSRPSETQAPPWMTPSASPNPEPTMPIDTETTPTDTETTTPIDTEHDRHGD